MKNINIILVLLISISFTTNLYSQEKRIFGTVFMTETDYSADNFFGEKITPVGFVKIYLLTEDLSTSNWKLKTTTKEPTFDFDLSQKEMSKYTHLEFLKDGSSRIVKIDSIKNDSLKIYLISTVVVKKPAIYLYPSEKIEIIVKHDFKGRILNTYPKYNENWTVIAEPSGKLFNTKDNRFYSYLFWDGEYSFHSEHYNYNSGFYVERENTIEFLQSKLEYIGLNETEINDFIIFWLPELNQNQINFIHFGINDNIDNSSFLNISPKPETEIRVFMEFQEYLNTKKLPEQILPKIERKGFTLVEWGGAEINQIIFE